LWASPVSEYQVFWRYCRWKSLEVLWLWNTYSQTLRYWGQHSEALINCSTTYPMVEMHAESFVIIASLWIPSVLKISVLEVTRTSEVLWLWNTYSQTLRHWGQRSEALINCCTTYPMVKMHAESFVSIASLWIHRVWKILLLEVTRSALALKHLQSSFETLGLALWGSDKLLHHISYRKKCTLNRLWA